MLRATLTLFTMLAVFALPAQAAPLQIESVVLRPLIETEAPLQKAGVLSRIAVAEGVRVEAGDLLAALDDRVAALALRQAVTERDQVRARVENQLRIEYAEKALEVARAELARSQESIAEFAGSISQSQLDVERLTIEKLVLERKQAEHELELERFELRLKEDAVEAAELNLELHRLRASFSGTVVLIRGRLGEWVEPGKPVLRLVATDQLRAEGFADADAVKLVQVGVEVVLTIGADNFPGTLRFVSPEVDPVTNQVRIWAEIDNKDGELRPGERGSLDIPTQRLAEPPRDLSQSREDAKP